MTRKELGVLLLLVALCAIVAIASPQFLSVTNVQNLARLVGMYGMFSIGVGIVIITGGIDLSVGSICALLGVLLSMMLVEWRWPASVALSAVLAFGACLGAAHGLLVTRLRLPPFIVTLCGLLLYRGAARYIARDATKGFGASEGFEWLRTLAAGSIGGVPMPFVLLCIVAIVAWLLLHRSVYGRHLFASGHNEEASSNSKVGQYAFFTWNQRSGDLCFVPAGLMFFFLAVGLGRWVWMGTA